ncbi:ATP-binding protein [Streptomyces sp. MNP-20]|uniref:ATP-binding protein n=1 Tax=Streptomyces sp. MNP-20 TaxID=2721165 RepID=UPI001551F245|nr:ATP-binding protein [Streptomyces sp. MNP-20]
MPEDGSKPEPGPGAEPWEYTLHIPRELCAVTVCRHTLRVILAVHGLGGVVDVAELLATELVSNAVRHTKGPVSFRLLWADGVLRIGAWDADPTPPAPTPRPAPLDLEDGRGLDLIRCCSDTWGWHPLPKEGDAGKYVWCELGAAA